PTHGAAHPAVHPPRVLRLPFRELGPSRRPAARSGPQWLRPSSHNVRNPVQDNGVEFPALPVQRHVEETVLAAPHKLYLNLSRATAMSWLPRWGGPSRSGCVNGFVNETQHDCRDGLGRGVTAWKGNSSRPVRLG